MFQNENELLMCFKDQIFQMNWFPESHKRNTTKTRMFGCLVHNHADNPTMKRITWLQKRRIAKHLLLGHTRMDIWKNIMPKLHIEGQKRVDSQDVRRVHEAIQKDKHHKLREGHDIASLLGKVARWQILVPSFPWIAPGWRAWEHLATLPRRDVMSWPSLSLWCLSFWIAS